MTKVSDEKTFPNWDLLKIVEKLFSKWFRASLNSKCLFAHQAPPWGVPQVTLNRTTEHQTKFLYYALEMVRTEGLETFRLRHAWTLENAFLMIAFLRRRFRTTIKNDVTSLYIVVSSINLPNDTIKLLCFLKSYSNKCGLKNS